MKAQGKPLVLGISASHNGGACLLGGNIPLVAIQEERLTRKKRDRIYGSTGSLSIRYCLEAAGIGPDDLDLVVVCTTGRQRQPIHDVRRNPVLSELARAGKVRFLSHHLGHAISAYAVSGFDEAVILVADGMGSPLEDLSPRERDMAPSNMRDPHEVISVYHAVGRKVEPVFKQFVANGNWLVGKSRGMPYYGSLGGLYAAVAHQIFGQSMEAGKVMGLAPFAEPAFKATDFWDWRNRSFVFLPDVPNALTQEDWWPENEDEHAALAAAAQAGLEEALLFLCREVVAPLPISNFCYAGGVALNSVANQKLVRSGMFSNWFIQPAAEDNGAAIGAAYYGLWSLTGESLGVVPRMNHDFLGRCYSQESLERSLMEFQGVRLQQLEDPARTAAELLEEGEIIGWFEGGSEFGPRALGHRSILADPRNPKHKTTLNKEIKQREEFRPFAPSVLEEEFQKWFDTDSNSSSCSPFMLLVDSFRVPYRNLVPAVCHVDGTGRLQTVGRQHNSRFRGVIEKFYEITGIPLVLNTSFNARGEPIVETPSDAIRSANKMQLRYCIIEDMLITLNS